MPMVATSPSMRSHSWSDVNSVVMIFLRRFWILAFANSAFVGVGNERHGRDPQRQALPAQFGEYGAAHDRLWRRQIAHRHRCIQARPEAAGGDRADLLG